MSGSIDPTSLSLSSLRHCCAQESDRFFKRQSHDPRYCYELFRRAVLGRDQHAWELLYVQYQPLVTGWVERHTLFSALDEEAQFYVNWAFEKMWSVMTAEKFAHFADLKSILRYLQMCVHSVIIDSLRAREQAVLLDDEAEPEIASVSADREPGLEAKVLARSQAAELWRMLDQRFRSEKERQIVYGSFVLGLKPTEVYALYPSTFRDVKEVYLVKDNLLARLRRDAELREFFNEFE